MRKKGGGENTLRLSSSVEEGGLEVPLVAFFEAWLFHHFTTQVK